MNDYLVTRHSKFGGAVRYYGDNLTDLVSQATEEGLEGEVVVMYHLLTDCLEEVVMAEKIGSVKVYNKEPELA